MYVLIIPPTNEIKDGGILVGRSVGEMLCLKLFPQFSSHPNKTWYTWSLPRIDVHDINCEVWPKGFSVMPLFSKFIPIIINECLSYETVLKMVQCLMVQWYWNLMWCGCSV